MLWIIIYKPLIFIINVCIFMSGIIFKEKVKRKENQGKRKKLKGKSKDKEKR